MIKLKNNKKTYVALVLDKSGSMETIRDETISGFNENLQEHRANGRKGGETFLSLFQFNSAVEETYFNVPIDKIEGELDKEQYVPGGMTALYDAIGVAVTKLQKFDQPGDVAFLVIVLSDGMENSSSKYNFLKIKDMRKELESTGRWTFQFIGCDPDAIRAAQGMGLRSHQFENTPDGVKKLFGQVNYSTQNYYASREIGATSVANFMDTSNTVEPDTSSSS